jgi:hypothetical protein
VVHARAHRRHLQGINFSVADPGCLPRIRLFAVLDPGYELSPSRIPDSHQRI